MVWFRHRPILGLITIALTRRDIGRFLNRAAVPGAELISPGRLSAFRYLQCARFHSTPADRRVCRSRYLVHAIRVFLQRRLPVAGPGGGRKEEGEMRGEIYFPARRRVTFSGDNNASYKLQSCTRSRISDV